MRQCDKFDLEKYLLDDFGDSVHKNASLMNIFIYDSKYYALLRERNLVDNRAISFLDEYELELKSIKQRKLNIAKEMHRKIIRNYIEGKDISNCADGESEMFCPFDGIKLRNDGYRNEYPVYSCPECYKKFTRIETVDDLSKVKIEGGILINLRTEDKFLRERPTISLYSFINRNITVDNDNAKPNAYLCEKVYPNKCRKEGCEQTLIKAAIPPNEGNISNIRFCPKCGYFYMPMTIKSKYENLFNYHKMPKPNSVPIEPDNQPVPENPKLPVIPVKNFLVRQNKYRCYKRHEIEEIKVAVNMISPNGKPFVMTVSAGHCRQCNEYFILEGTYQRLKAKGIIACRVTDEKAYIERCEGKTNKIFASESILKQYGYNVSQENALTAKQRHTILAMVMDYGICKKQQILSFIDSLISNRELQNDRKYEIAISKWEADRKFVDSYKLGDKRYVIAGEIIRK